MNELEKKIEEAARDYSILENGKPREHQYYEMTELGLDYQVTKAFTEGALSPEAKEYWQQDMKEAFEAGELYDNDGRYALNKGGGKALQFKYWLEQNKKK